MYLHSMSSINAMFPHTTLLVFLLFLVFSPRAHVGKAADSLSSGLSLSGNQTVVSKGLDFELGFFSPGNSGKYYIGIWFRRIPKQTVVWVANREVPVFDPSTSELRISENGNLVLLNHAKASVWSSNSSTTSSAMDSFVAILLDTGNLILTRQSNSSAVIWQSFDHPTDTWLPGGWVGLNKVTGEYQYLRSWRNAEDPAPGQFSYHMDERETNEFFLRWNGSMSYWETGVWNGQFSKIPELKSSRHFNFSYIDDVQRRGYTYSVYSGFLFTRASLDPSGQIKLLVWLQDTHDWQQVWEQPVSQCDVYSLCGAFGVCNERSTPPCECLQGFEPANEKDWELGDWSGGCVRRTHSNYSACNKSSGNKYGLLPMPGLRLPTNSQVLAVEGRKECELACLEDCNCTACTYGSGCLVWKGELRNAQKLYGGDSNARTLYVRLPSSELPSSTNEHTRPYGVIIGVLLGVIVLTFPILGLICRLHRRSCGAPNLAEGSLVAFTYANLQHITNNFSEKLGGGGFGCVFRGTLSDSTAVAVKRLEGSGQGEKQFCAEVSTLGTIHHVNLVRLHGFCAEGTKKLLVYEYMPNGSLDVHLFGSRSSGGGALNWNLRYQIILGVARGLAYLHEKCRESIIHCDIKPENILLDAEFQPKVADFGLAKLLDRDFSRVLTTMRGTIGYVAPEWLSGLPITPKADVYSFGMLVLETISGRRNTQRYESGSTYYFPLWAAFKVNEGEVLGLLDEKLEGSADTEQLTRACKVACWCIQECEEHRPSMTQVIQILEGVFRSEHPTCSDDSPATHRRWIPYTSHPPALIRSVFLIPTLSL